MKSLHQVLKISAKESFKTLRKHGPYFCESLSQNIYITNLFWNHINFSKERSIREIVERLSIIPLIERVLQEGQCVKTTEDRHLIFYRITLTIKHLSFPVICKYNKKERGHNILLSCFIDIQKK